MVLGVVGSIPHGRPIELFLIAVLHDWSTKGHGMCYPMCEMVHIKAPFLLIEKSSSYSGGKGFTLFSYLSCSLPF